MLSENKLFSGNVSQYKSLSPFKNREEMDLAIRSHLYNHKHKFTKNQDAIMHIISQMAFKFKGIAFVKVCTLVKETGISDKTIRRALNLFVKLNILSKYPTQNNSKKIKGGKGHNVYVFNQTEIIDFDSLNKPSDQSNDQSNMTNRELPENDGQTLDTTTMKTEQNDADTKFSDSKPSKEFKTYYVHSSSDKNNSNHFLSLVQRVSHWVPVPFTEVAKTVFTTPKQIETCYNVLRKEMSALVDFTDNEKLNLSIRSVLAYFRKVNDDNTVIDSPFGYIKGVLKNLVSELVIGEEQEHAANDDTPFFSMDEVFKNADSDYKKSREKELFNSKNSVVYNWLETN
jgi:Fe2+ or Zn2+ uptake regulation protein